MDAAVRAVLAAVLAVVVAGAAVGPAASAFYPILPIERGAFNYDPRPGLGVDGYWAWEDYPYYVPLKRPVVVVAAEDVVSANFTGPVTLTVQTPVGSYERILLRVDVWLESSVPGRPAVQYDRPLWVWVDGAPALIGTTVQRFNHTAFQDVTFLYPLLVGGGQANVTVALPNWNLPAWGLTGVFHVRVTILYYPGPKPAWVPDYVIPLWVNPGWGVARTVLTPDNPVAWQVVSLPRGTYRVLLLLYTEGASYDEFFYYMIPPDRYVIVRANGSIVAFAQPYPYMYTGSLNPLLWRPVPGVRTLSFEPHVIDLTPVLGLIAPTSNLTVEVYNQLRYWNIFAALLVYADEESIAFYRLLDYNVTGPNRQESTQAIGSYDNVTVYNYTLAYSTMALEASTLIVLAKYWGLPQVAIANGYMENTMRATQIYDDAGVWSNLTLEQHWVYEANISLPWKKVVFREEWEGYLDSKYGFIIDVELPENPEEYPVTGNFTLYTQLYQSLRIDRSPWPFTETHRALEESVDAEAFINGTIMMISPTAGIITGITGTYGENNKTITAWEEGRRVNFHFERVLRGWNEWPEWAILEDRVRVEYG